jgi:hypothetical protein
MWYEWLGDNGLNLTDAIRGLSLTGAIRPGFPAAASGQHTLVIGGELQYQGKTHAKKKRGG